VIPTAFFLRRFARNERGVAAVEMAMIGGLLTGALMNVAEVGRYAYLTTEVSAASQAAAQAAIITCSTDRTPVTTNCPAVAADEPGGEGEGLARQRQRGTVKQHEEAPGRSKQVW